MLVHSVRRVPPPKSSSSQRISKPPHLYSSTWGASARVTVVSVTRGVGAPTVVSFTLVPALPRSRSASKGAHSRRCAGSVIASQTFCGEWRSSRTRMSVQFSSPFCPRSFRICAPLAGPGVYCERPGIFFSLACPACQLGELNEVAAGVFQHGNSRAGHIGRRLRELGATRLDLLVVALDVVREEQDGGLALLKDRLLIRFGRGVVIQRQLQLGAVRLLGRGHGQPAIGAVTEVGLLGKAQYLRIEAQGGVLVVDVYAGHFDFHFVSPFSGRGLGRVGISLCSCSLVLTAPGTEPGWHRPPALVRALSPRTCARWRTATTRGPERAAAFFADLLTGFCWRSVIFFSLSSFSSALTDSCGRGGVREHLRERTRTGGTDRARHPPREMVRVSAGRDGAVRPP